MQQLKNEVRQLRKEKADLEDTIDILKKSGGHLQSKPEKKYATIRERSGEYSVEKMCRALKVSQSGYYRRLTYQESATKWENQAIYDVLKGSYQRNKLLDDVRLKYFLGAVAIVFTASRRNMDCIRFDTVNSRPLRIPNITILWLPIFFIRIFIPTPQQSLSNRYYLYPNR